MNSASIDAFDELADLFLTEGDPAPVVTSAPPSPRARQSMPQPRIDILLTGHLPVRGGVWLAPYAAMVACDTAESVALVRVDGDEPMIEVLGGERDSMPSTHATFRAAVARLAPTIQTWLIRGPYEPGGGDRPDVEGGADRVTILSGADSAAIVAAYQTIKSIVATAAAEDRSPPPIALAVVGAADAAAARMFDRISQTAQAQLGISIEPAPRLPRIDVGAEAAWSMTFAGEPVPASHEVVAWIRAASNTYRNAPAAVAPAPLRREADDQHEPVAVVESIRRERTAEAQSPFRLHAPDRTASSPRKLMPKPSVTFESKAAPSEPGPDAGSRSMPRPREALSPDTDQLLAVHVEGLRAIAPRCPRYEHIELAVDEAGTLHLLGRDRDLRDLRIVEAWADGHRELIAAAVPDVEINRGSTIHCHLFTERPTEVADLHTTPLHLHVLAPVRIADQTGWYSAPLNR